MQALNTGVVSNPAEQIPTTLAAPQRAVLGVRPQVPSKPTDFWQRNDAVVQITFCRIQKDGKSTFQGKKTKLISCETSIFLHLTVFKYM